MEDFGEFSCCDCNMVFRSLGLLDKHKTRFCIGSGIGDPVRLQKRRVESGQPEQTTLRELFPKMSQTSNLISLREQRHKLLRQKDMREPVSQDNVAESLVINKLTDEIQKLRFSIEESLPRRPTEGDTDERLREAREHHSETLAQIRAHNTQLEQQREEIERRLAELSEQGSSDHVEDLLQELKEQEEKNEEILHHLSTQINGLQGMKESDVPSEPVEDKKPQHITFDLISVDGPLSSQIRSLRLAYMHSGGADPEVLAHMHDLQAEALTLEQARARAEDKAEKRRAKPSHHTVDSDLVAVQHENQRLEEEILRLQLVRKRHRGKEGIHLMQRHQLHQVASLQAEISSLRREVERSRDRGGLSPHPPILGEPLGLNSEHYSTLDNTSQHSVMDRQVPNPLDTLDPAPYDPVAGLLIFFDMVLGIDATYRALRLVAGLYSVGQEMGRRTFTPTVQCWPAGTLACPLSRNLENYAVLAVKQPVPRLQPSPSISLILEVQAAGGLDTSGQEINGLVPQGWTMLQLFDHHNQVQSGFWRLPVYCLPASPSLSPAQLNSVPQLGNMEICLRMINARDGGVQSLTKVDPNNPSHYKYPPMVIPNFVPVLEARAPHLTTQ